MKYPLFLILFSAILLLSCSKDDDSNNNNDESQNLLVGVWKPIKEVDRCPNQTDDVYNFNDCEQMTRLTFNGNNTLTEIGYNDNSGNCEVSYENNTTWNFENGKLFVVDNGVEEEVEFLELSSNNLKLGEFDNDFCSNGIFFTEFVKVN